MNLRKFVGATSRSVLAQVRMELGADAVILDNRSTAAGIEITALAGTAVDDILRPAAVPEVLALPPIAAPSVAIADAVKLAPDTLRDDIAALRAVVEGQLAQFAWHDTLRRDPLRAKLTRELLHAGFGPELSRDIARRLPDDFTAADAQRWVCADIASRIHIPPADSDIVTRGGVYALTGATGVGKTTTAAKLAARCAVRHGGQSIALLTTDTYRIGAHDQLRIYARILGIGVHTINGPDDLRQALDSLRGKHLVLIDTVGMGQRDARVREHAMLLAQPEVTRLLVLAATAQAETLDDVATAYAPAPNGSSEGFGGCIITKLDEAIRLGDVLDVVIRRRMPVHYLSAGQRVPEDLHAPNSSYLVDRALRAAAKSNYRALDDDEVGIVLGAAAGALHG